MRIRATMRSKRALERIVDHREEDPAVRSDKTLLRELIQQAVVRLHDGIQTVIQLRFGLGGYSYDLEETGRILRISRERAKAMECKGLRVLMKILKNYAQRNLDQDRE
jgi:RNA polymerase primary sigma factor